MSVRTLLKIDDLDPCYFYCEEGIIKTKTNFHCVSIASDLPDPLPTSPASSSIPMYNNEVIISDGGIIEETYNDCVLRWQYNCNGTWALKSQNINLNSNSPLDCSSLGLSLNRK